MREGGQRTPPLLIRREARLSPSQTFSLTSSSVSRARCGNGLSRRFSPSLFHWVPFWTVTLRCLSAAHQRLVARYAVRAALENRARWRARRGKPRGIFRAHSSGPEERVHAPLAGSGGLWHNTSADIVYDASCGPLMLYPRGETGRSLSSPTLLTPTGASSKPPTQQRRGPRPKQTAPRNARGRQTCTRSAGRAGGHRRCGRERPARLRQGTSCPCTPREAGEYSPAAN